MQVRVHALQAQLQPSPSLLPLLLRQDVAGPAWDDAAGLPTGFGAATLAELVLLLGKQQQQQA